MLPGRRDAVKELAILYINCKTVRSYVVRVRRIFLDGSVFCVETVFEMSSVFKLLALALALSLSSPPEQAAHINAT